MKKYTDLLLVFVAILGLVFCGNAQAANVTWDITPGTVGAGSGGITGGAGTWNTANGNWTIDGGANNIAWVNGSNDTAVFGGTAGTVTLGEGITVGGLTFNIATYTVTGNTLTFGAAGIISNSVAATISSAIDGTGPITKNGVGTLTLSGSNTYNGGTVLNAGTVSISADTNLGAAGNGITFNGSATLQHTATVNVGSRPITLNNNALAIITPDANGKNFTTSGAVTGNGGLQVKIGTAGNNTPYNLLATGDGITTGNTFTGPITIGDGIGNGGVPVTMNSLADSANPIVLNSGVGNIGGGWTYGVGATTSLTLNNRQFQLGAAAVAVGNNTINNASTKNLTINTDIGFVGTGARGFTLAGGSATVTNVFAGRITDNTGGALSLTANGTWYLAGTNTYSGYTTLGTGVLYIQGLQALSPNTTTVEIPHSGSVPLRLLGDGTGTVNYPNTTIYCNGNNAGTVHGIFVGNNTPANGGNNPGSPGANCTIAFNNMTFFQKSDNANINVDVTGANGFRLQLNNVTLPVTGQSTFGNITFNPTTAPVTLAGTIIQSSGNSSGVGPKTLVLGGTATNNLVSGSIKDALDYPSNANARPLNLTKSGTSTWTLSGVNTHSGSNTVSAGTLVINGGKKSQCLSDTNLLAIAGGKVQLNTRVREKVGSLKLGAGSVLTGPTTYGSTASSAANKNDTYFAGTGVLYVNLDIPADGTVIMFR